MKKNTRSRAGFTLIELMVSIVILAVLMSAMFLMLKLGDKESEKAATLAKLEQLNTLITAYHNQYGVYPPVPVYPTGSRTVDNDGTSKTQPTQPIQFWIHTDGPNVPSPSNASWDQIGSGERFVVFGLLSFFYPRGTIFNRYLSESYKSFFQSGIKQGNVQLSNQFDSEIGSIGTLVLEEEADPRVVIMRRYVTDLENKGVITVTHGPDPITRNVYYTATVKANDEGGGFWYASLPPYQSYVLWSSGPNGKTCRACWLGTCTASGNTLEKHREWNADDLGKFDK